MMERRTYGTGILLALFAAVCWSTSGIFVQNLARGAGLSAVSLAFWREAGTAGLLLVYLLLFNRRLLIIQRSDLKILIFLGAVGVGLFHIFWNTSVVVNGVSIATILQYNDPIFVAIGAAFFFREKFSLRKVAALCLTLGGTVMVSLSGLRDGLHISMVGLFFGIGSAVIHSVYHLASKHLAGDYHPVTIVFYSFLFAFFALLPLQIGGELPTTINAPILLNFAGLVIVTTIIGFSIYQLSLRYLPVSHASIVVASEVFIAAVLSYLLLGERLTFYQIFGALLIVSGVVVVSLRRLKVTDAQPGAIGG